MKASAAHPLSLPILLSGPNDERETLKEEGREREKWKIKGESEGVCNLIPEQRKYVFIIVTVIHLFIHSFNPFICLFVIARN